MSEEQSFDGIRILQYRKMDSNGLNMLKTIAVLGKLQQCNKEYTTMLTIICLYSYAILSQYRDSVTKAKCKTNMTYEMIFLQKIVHL